MGNTTSISITREIPCPEGCLHGMVEVDRGDHVTHKTCEYCHGEGAVWVCDSCSDEQNEPGPCLNDCEPCPDCGVSRRYHAELHGKCRAQAKGYVCKIATGKAWPPAASAESKGAA